MYALQEQNKQNILKNPYDCSATNYDTAVQLTFEIATTRGKNKTKMIIKEITLQAAGLAEGNRKW